MSGYATPVIPYGRPRTEEELAPPVSLYATHSDTVIGIPGVPYGRPKSMDIPRAPSPAIAGPSRRYVPKRTASADITTAVIANPVVVVTADREVQTLQALHIVHETHHRPTNQPNLSEKARGKQREMPRMNYENEEQQATTAHNRKPLSANSDSDMSIPSLAESDDDNSSIDAPSPPRTPSPPTPVQAPEKSATRKGRPNINFGSGWLRQKGRDHTGSA